jgi:hypothetical protein
MSIVKTIYNKLQNNTWDEGKIIAAFHVLADITYCSNIQTLVKHVRVEYFEGMKMIVDYMKANNLFSVGDATILSVVRQKINNKYNFRSYPF